ncbi:MAG: helix-turn-helix transcriptional regulator [Terriglobia bacterium]
MDQPKLFGKRVRAVRKAAKITQEEAAEAAGLNPKYLGEIERGEKRPSFEAILALAKALRVSPAVFFHFDREETDEKILRKRIEALLQKCRPQQLQQVYRVVKVMLEP